MQFFPTTPISKINPLKDPESRVLTTWNAKPVFKFSDTEKIIPDGLLLMGQVKNGKTRIVEKTAQTLGTGWAAIYMYNIPHDRFDIISSVYHHKDQGGRMEVDVPAEGMEEILRHILATGEDGATANAKIIGKQHMAAVTAIPTEMQVTNENGLLPISGTEPTKGYFASAQPRDSMSYIEDKQTLFVVLAVVAQLVILLTMNYTTYQPYAQLMKALQVRGFVKPGDRPTFGKVIRVYFYHKPRKLWADFKVKGFRACLPQQKAAQVGVVGDGDAALSPTGRPRSGSSSSSTSIGGKATAVLT